MNKLQQEIIEIIEPYMDKTLSEGCIISNEFISDEEDIEIGKIIDWTSYDGLYTFEIKSFINGICSIYAGEEEFNDLKIIGHYDITAVLKYIEDNTGEQMHSFIEQDKIIYEFEIGSRSARSIEIQNKPLYLYSDEENKDLLKLLKELGTKN